MDPLTGGLLIGGANLLGSIFSTEQNNQNAQAMLQQQESYQTQMSNTAYSRAVSDMKNAGLNPAMMFGSGGSASTPSVQQPQMSSAFSSVGPSVEKAINSAVQLKTADKTIDNLVEQNAQIKADAALKQQEARTSAVEAGVKGEQAGKIRAETINERALLPQIANKSLTAQNESAIEPHVRKLADQLGFGGKKADEALSPVGNLISSARGARALFNDRFYY